MENFVNNTEVSFSQLTKKSGWFSRLIFFQLTVYPAIFLFFGISRLILSQMTTGFLVFNGIFIAGSWTISFLLWKKQTRFTITASIILLWILCVFRHLLSVLAAGLLLGSALGMPEANKSLINYRIGVLIYMIVFAVIVLVLTVRWTRNLRQLKRLQP